MTVNDLCFFPLYKEAIEEVALTAETRFDVLNGSSLFRLFPLVKESTETAVAICFLGIK
jgi:hypothetical protein